MSKSSNRNTNRSYSRNNTSQYRDYSRYSRASASRNYSRNSSPNASNINLSGSNYGRGGDDKYSGLDVEVSQYSRTGTNHYSHRKNVQKRKNARKKNIFVCLIILLVLGIIGVGVYKFFPIKVSINNKECQLTYGKALSDAIESSGINVKPGNYVAVDNSVLKAGEGNEFYCEVNGKEVTDKNYRLYNGDTVSYQNGKDIMEEYTSIDSDIKATSEIKGSGSIHKFNGDGSNGVWSKMTGKVSKKYAERQTKAPGDVVCENQNVNPGSDKVIALTFDDGPSDEYTQKILDVLKKYNAKATFCVIGENCEESWGKKLLQAEDAAGHQIITHSYDHARPVGGTDMTLMSNEKQIQEITKGQNIIAQAIGHDASTVVRLPGGNMDENTVRLIAPYVTAEIGWNVDTADWKEPGVTKIVNAMKEANSGDIILCHDGGGDRSQTVSALEEILPYFTEKGYKFITVDELMQYPAASQKTKF